MLSYERLLGYVRMHHSVYSASCIKYHEYKLYNIIYVCIIVYINISEL